MTRTMKKGQSSALMLLVLVAPVVAGLSLLPEAIAEPTQIIPFDTDEDGDVDGQDFIVLESCLSGPMSPHDGTGMCYEVDNDLDGHIDLRDYAALQACFTGSENPADPCCAESHSAAEVAQELADAGYEAGEITQVLADFGFSAEDVAGVLADSFGLDVDAIRATLRNLGYSEQEIFEATAGWLAYKFAPQLRFDSGGQACSQAPSFPWSAQVYFDLVIKDVYCACPRYAWGNQGYDPIPTYWKAFRCGNQVRIMYWWFYGYQFDCDCVSGEHHADWEQVMVSLNEDALGNMKLFAVTFWAHGEWGTRWAGNFGYAQHILLWGGTHPIVYVGRTTHASYFSRQALVQTCTFWHDKHDGDGFWLDPGVDGWRPLIRLQPLGSGSQEWMFYDLEPYGDWCWGCEDGSCAHICAHPTQDSNYWCLMSGCNGSEYCSESDVASGWPIPYAP